MNNSDIRSKPPIYEMTHCAVTVKSFYQDANEQKLLASLLSVGREFSLEKIPRLFTGENPTFF